MAKSEAQEDLDRLLKEYDSPNTNGTKWPKHQREPGCSRTALRRCFIVSFLGLVGVSVGWFLHVNVFMDNPSPSPTNVQQSLLAGFGSSKGSDGTASGWMEMVSKSGILDDINMTAVVDYAMKHIPPALAARLLTHVDDIKNGDFMKLLEDVQLMDGLLDFLEVPEDFPGLAKIQKKVDDYDYEDKPIPRRTTLVPRRSTKGKVEGGFEFLKSAFGTTPKSMKSSEEKVSYADLKKVLEAELEKSKLEKEVKELQMQLEKQKQLEQQKRQQAALSERKKTFSFSPLQRATNHFQRGMFGGQERDFDPQEFGGQSKPQEPQMKIPNNNQYGNPYHGNGELPAQHPAFRPQFLPSDEELMKKLYLENIFQQQQQQLPLSLPLNLPLSQPQAHQFTFEQPEQPKEEKLPEHQKEQELPEPQEQKIQIIHKHPQEEQEFTKPKQILQQFLQSEETPGERPKEASKETPKENPVVIPIENPEENEIHQKDKTKPQKPKPELEQTTTTTTSSSPSPLPSSPVTTTHLSEQSAVTHNKPSINYQNQSEPEHTTNQETTTKGTTTQGSTSQTISLLALMNWAAAP